jgi:hypothetical protein
VLVMAASPSRTFDFRILQALESGMQEKRKEFVETGAELYTKL